MTTRHTVDTITSDALDQLYDRLERAEDTLLRARKAAQWMRRNYPGLRLANDTLTAALDDQQPSPAPAEVTGYCPACGRGDVAPTVDEYEQQRQRAERAEAAITHVQALTDEHPVGIDTALIHEALDTGATGHRYLSTGCLHGHHDYCQNRTGQAGQKTPAQCKFCTARCVCPCHTDPPADQPTTKEN